MNLNPCLLRRVSGAGLNVPTHFFTVVTRCREQNVTVEECGDGPLDVFSFLLPHREDNSEACNVSVGGFPLQQGAAGDLVFTMRHIKILKVFVEKKYFKR